MRKYIWIFFMIDLFRENKMYSNKFSFWYINIVVHEIFWVLIILEIVVTLRLKWRAKGDELCFDLDREGFPGRIHHGLFHSRFLVLEEEWKKEKGRRKSRRTIKLWPLWLQVVNSNLGHLLACRFLLLIYFQSLSPTCIWC